VGEIKRLYVRPEARRAGHARVLMAEAIAAARRAGYSMLQLETLPAMMSAQALYASLGFVEDSRTDDVIRMTMPLA
jgi:ribosomal protein S18 acetylase RimI-like enzyme